VQTRGDTCTRGLQDCLKSEDESLQAITCIDADKST